MLKIMIQILFRVGNQISKYTNMFAKGYTPNWWEVFIIKKAKNTITWAYVIEDFDGEEIVRMFYENEL